jgi:vacuolar-type H+-ATPase subunit E/Vma4
VSDLTALLEHEASAEIDAILTEARERAAAIVAQARGEAEAAQAARERASKGQAEALRVRAQSAAQLEASSLRLRAQHEAVESVFTQVREALAALARDGGRYERVLDALVAEALAALRGEPAVEVVVAERDVPLALSLLKRHGVAVPVVPGDVEGGVRIRTGRGSSIENTLAGRLASLREELASQVTKVLFAETTG